MNKQIIVTASVLGLLAVVCGAFAAHGLTNLIGQRQIQIWHTAVQYQFYHVFALLFLATLSGLNSKLVKVCYYLFTLGIVTFSGSLYLLACRDLLGLNRLTIIIGPITPLGGLLFIAGWITLALAAYKK